jgi:ankyrin repeat protein
MPDDVFTASQNGDLVKLRIMLEANPSLVKDFHGDGWTALHLAAHFGQLEAAELLLSYGADSNARSLNSFDNTPLHAAVAGNHADMVELLVADGSDLNSRQHGGWTPLHGAAHHGNLKMAQFLVHNGADTSIQKDDGLTAFDIALEKGFTEVAEFLGNAQRK